MSIIPDDHMNLPKNELDPPRREPRMPPAIPNGDDKRAEALAEIRRMHDALNSANEENGQLRADLNRADDRLVLLMDERNRQRRENHILLTALIQLATEVEVINRQSARAVEVLKNANALMHEVDGSDPDDDTSLPLGATHVSVDAAVAALEEELRK